jgi:hypothetical protein
VSEERTVRTLAILRWAAVHERNQKPFGFLNDFVFDSTEYRWIYAKF